MQYIFIYVRLLSYCSRGGALTITGGRGIEKVEWRYTDLFYVQMEVFDIMFSRGRQHEVGRNV
jgi:hypothetical protein